MDADNSPSGVGKVGDTAACAGALMRIVYPRGSRSTVVDPLRVRRSRLAGRRAVLLWRDQVDADSRYSRSTVVLSTEQREAGNRSPSRSKEGVKMRTFTKLFGGAATLGLAAGMSFLAPAAASAAPVGCTTAPGGAQEASMEGQHGVG